MRFLGSRITTSAGHGVKEECCFMEHGEQNVTRDIGPIKEITKGVHHRAQPFRLRMPTSEQ